MWAFKLVVGLGCLLCVACNPRAELPAEIEAAYERLPAELDYNFHVKPILSDKCFACHGPDQANQKAGLRLDRAEGAYAELESGRGPAIVPHKPNKSELFWRIISDDPDLVMPTPSSHLTLDAKEVATLVKWIEEGATYKAHWSFIPVVQPKIPQTDQKELAQNEIDHFILARLAQRGQTYSPSASKEKFIRRVSFSLTGLPPDLEEIDAFVADQTSDAYETLIDRLLDSPAYGERMASNWMDIARFTDSDGYLDDKHRDFSPYRDWVINAFNENMSYEQFVTWQLAGDLLPNKRQESILATAFNRLHKRNSEAGIVFEEFRVEYVADRTNTLGKAFLALSAECARCHDHKYDPISQKEYYQLFAFFNSTDEWGSAVYGPSQNPGPSLLLTDSLSVSKIDSLRTCIAQLEAKGQEIADNRLQDHSQLTLTDVQRSLEKKLVAHYAFEQVQKGREKGYELKEARGQNASFYFNTQPDLREGGYQGKAYFFKEYNASHGPKGVGWYDRTDPFSIQFAIFPDTLYEEAHILWHSEERRLGLKGYSFALDQNRLRFIMAHSWPQNALDLMTVDALPVKTWSHITLTYDGSSHARGIQLYVNGKKAATHISRDHLYKSILFVPDVHTYGFSNLSFGSRVKEEIFARSGIDELKVYNGQLSALEVQASLDLSLSQDPHQWAVHLLNNKNDSYQVLQQTLHQAREKENEYVNDIKEIMVMGDLSEPRPTYVLERGLYSERGEEVEVGVPASILPFAKQLPKNRLGLAQWLFDNDNPLTARVFVNRIWMMHFGRGLVKTAEDFGNQGDLPSHPDLLDWLAHDFMTHDWDIKRLHKQIMLSAAYQQSSAITPEALEKDPENIWLARGPNLRLTAEMLRDNVLAISGLLEKRVGGYSVYPYQPQGLWDELTTKGWAYKYPDEATEGIYRRSLYTFWKRQSPHPAMQIFDIANRDVCTVRRRVSNTPLQALILLNDPQFVEASRKLAEQVLTQTSKPSQQVERVFRLCTSRSPDQTELDWLLAFYEQERTKFSANPQKALAYLNTGKSPWNQQLDPVEIAALGVVSNTILNTDEAIMNR